MPNPAMKRRWPSWSEALIALLLVSAASACSHAGRPAGSDAGLHVGASESAAKTPAKSSRDGYPTIEVAPLPGWPKWLGEVNLQMSGLAFRDGHLYGVGDQSSTESRTILEILLPPDAAGAAATPADKASDKAGASAAAKQRTVSVRERCRWVGGPHPDAEGLALVPETGKPERALMTLESHADALIEVGFDDCKLLATYPHMTGNEDNQGLEGIAVSPDGTTVYLVHETERTLLSVPRGQPGPARLIAKLRDAETLCDAVYDDRGTPQTSDDRLLLLDRNSRQIFDVTLDGVIVGRWHLSRWTVQLDPAGYAYGMVALEALAIASREPDGSLIVYAATDTPPEPLPYRRTKGPKETEGYYERRVGMLYSFKLPPFQNEGAGAGH